MKQISFNNYFKDNNKKYYNSSYLLKILEEILGMDITTIKRKVDGIYINVSEDEIKEYLSEILIKENPELKERIETPKKKRNRNLSEWSGNDIKNSSKAFIDKLNMTRYTFEPYTLEYFIKYTSIVRNKINRLLNIIEKISDTDTELIEDELNRIDIELNQNKEISKQDIVRLITPTLYNIKILVEKVNKANNLDTYLNFKISKNSIYQNGFSENEIYPLEDIYVDNIELNNDPGCIPLSSRRKKKLLEKRNEDIKILTKILN